MYGFIHNTNSQDRCFFGTHRFVVCKECQELPSLGSSSTSFQVTDTPSEKDQTSSDGGTTYIRVYVSHSPETREEKGYFRDQGNTPPSTPE